MGRARSPPAFNYYTTITSPMTLLPSSPTVRGFTANNLRGSVRYWSRPPARALGDLPQWVARQAAMAVGLTHASAACVYRSGSRRARRLARRLACIASARLEMGPAACPAARSYRFGGWFDACPAACPTACVYRFGSRRARWLARQLVRRLPHR